MICGACQGWISPIVDKAAGTLACPKCGYSERRPFLPLFIVTGPSGAGKTAVVPELQRLLPEWEVFETDILWDSGGNWTTVKCNWLRIADSLAQRPHGRPTILCGTILPEHIAECDSRPLFSEVHWLALTCEPDVLAARLRARPAWRGCDEKFIVAQLEYLHWLTVDTATAIQPPLQIVDTTDAPISETARRVRDWAVTLRER